MDEQALAAWVEQASQALGLSHPIDVREVLQLAADAAHGVMRPAAPVTTFMAGLAVGASSDPDAMRNVVIALRDQLATWQHGS